MRAQTFTMWTLVPLTSPSLERNCPRCDRVRGFVCTGRFRVNASGRRLDVWLLFDCVACGATWRLPVHERVPVTQLAGPRLDAYHRNDAELAAAIAAAHGSGVGFAVRCKVPRGTFLATIRCPPGLRTRLDRVLAAALGVSRAAVRARWDAGGLAAVPGDRRALRRPVRDGQQVWVGDDRGEDDGCPAGRRTRA